jgi:hypothetical protein
MAEETGWPCFVALPRSEGDVRDAHDVEEYGSMIVPAAEFQRDIGTYQDRALAEPVFVTRDGRERTVLLSVEE